MIETPIRRGVKAQEAVILNQSPIEYDPSSHLAQDYYELFQQIWNKVNQGKIT